MDSQHLASIASFEIDLTDHAPASFSYFFVAFARGYFASNIRDQGDWNRTATHAR
jgi:hypothetical protein